MYPHNCRIIILLCGFLPALLYAQSTFSFRSAFGRPYALLSNVEVLTNGNIRVYGYLDPPGGGLNTGVLALELTPDGELTTRPRTYYRTDTELNAFAKGNRYGEFYYQGGHIQDSLYKAAAYRISSDTIEVIVESASENDQSFIFQPLGILADSSGLYLTGHERTYIDNNTTLHRNFLEKFTYHGQKEWGIKFGNETHWAYFAYTLIREGEELIVGGVRTNVKFRDVNKRERAMLWAFDTTGQMLWQWESPSHQIYDGAWDVLSAPDGGLVVASAYGREIVTSANYGYLVYQPCVFKLDEERRMIWQTQFRDNLASTDHRLNRIIEVSDGSGYVVTGRSSVYFPENDPETENPGDIGGIIAKVSPEGDSLWSRILIHPNLPSYIENGQLYDVKETPDGGFVMVGYSNHNLTEPSTQGWIIKVDEYGCLVPGCHLVSNAKEVSEAKINLLLSPNPTSDLLHVYVGPGTLPLHSELVIYDLHGRELQRRSASWGDATYLLEVGELPAGQYYVQLRSPGGQRSVAKAFAVVH